MKCAIHMMAMFAFVLHQFILFTMNVTWVLLLRSICRMSIKIPRVLERTSDCSSATFARAFN